jgi:hypothetical protein
LFVNKKKTILTFTGPLDYEYLSEYLKQLESPLTRIDNREELHDFILNNDVSEKSGYFEEKKKNLI